jgi:hypothetical protein
MGCLCGHGEWCASCTPSSAPTEAKLIKIADHILSDLLDRRGVGQELVAVKHDDKAIWREIQIAIGRRAWDAVKGEI